MSEPRFKRGDKVKHKFATWARVGTVQRPTMDGPLHMSGWWYIVDFEHKNPEQLNRLDYFHENVLEYSLLDQLAKAGNE